MITIDDVKNAKFNATLRTEGYNQAEVDRALDEIVDAMAHGRTPLLVRPFRMAKYPEQGYNYGQVDDLLDRLAAEGVVRF